MSFRENLKSNAKFLRKDSTPSEGPVLDAAE
jgi:hypothetical protein